MAKNAIWSHRFTIGHGWKWIHERNVTEEESSAWLVTFRQDEPNVRFVVVKTNPTPLHLRNPRI
jgi:hypothetical protein